MEGTQLVINDFDERIPAVTAADVLFDPSSQRMRG